MTTRVYDGHTPVGGGECLPDVNDLVPSDPGTIGLESVGPALADRTIGEVSGFAPPRVEESEIRHVDTVLAESVIGSDNRVQVQDTSIFPWRAMCSLEITTKTGARMVGSGTLIGPRTVLTAGHCIYIHQYGGFASSIKVTPGQNGHATPHGSAMATKFYTVTGWTRDRSREYDYGVIILPTPLGDTVGMLGYGHLADGELKNLMVNNAGYPADKPRGTLWWNASQIASVSDTQVFYTLDTKGGQSGSSIYRFIAPDQRIIVAVHAYGTGLADGALGGVNSGIRINKQVKENLDRWRE